MNILNELGEIASANYALQLKEPVYNAFVKLSNERKFELVSNFVQDDFAELEEVIDVFLEKSNATKSIRNILDMIMILNGRRAFFSKKQHIFDEKEKITYWINMLGTELVNSATGAYFDGAAIRGNGIVNGAKMRAAIYYILDILRYKEPYPFETPIVYFDTPCCILGRDIRYVDVYGTEDGIGYLNTTNNKYYVDLEIRNVYKYTNAITTVSLLIGDTKLYSGSRVTYQPSEPSVFTYGLYRIDVKDFKTEVRVGYCMLRENYVPSTADYDYETFGPANLYIRTLRYKGSDTNIIMPTHYESEGDIFTTVGDTTFSDTNVRRVEVPEGVTTIE